MPSIISAKPIKEPKRIPTRLIKSKGWISYGARNLYPTDCKRVLAASPTGVACREKFVDFLAGDGFENELLNEMLVNRRGQKALFLLRQIARDLAECNSYHFHINYNLNYEIDSIARVNPEYVRRGIPDSNGFVAKMAVWNNFSMDNQELVEKTYETFIDTYNPNPEVIAKQVELAGGIRMYKGQILSYWGDSDNEYPVALYDSVLNDLKIDAALSTKSLYDLENDFMANTVFIFKDKLEREHKAQLLSELKKSQGVAGRKVFLVDGAEDGLEMKTIEKHGSDQQYVNTEQAARRRIYRAWGQLPILHGEDRSNALSADGKAIQNAFIFYNNQTSRQRRMISQAFSMLLSRYKRPVEDECEIKKLSFEIEENADNTTDITAE